MKKMPSFILILALVNIPVLATTTSLSDNNDDGSLQDAPWPMFSHDEKHTGRSPYDTSMNKEGEIWRYEIPGGVVSSPAIGRDGVIYIGANTGLTNNLYAINIDGTLKWAYKTGDWIQSSPAIYNEGTIYVGSWNDNLYAINPNGTLKWKFDAGDTITSSPAIGYDGTIYFGVLGPGLDRGRIYALFPNGTEKWHYDTEFWVYSSPAIDEEGTIYIGSNDHYLYAINHNGTLKWKFQADDAIQSSPAIDDNGIIYVGSWDYYLYAIYSNGTLKWKFKTNGAIDDSSPAIGEDDIIYAGSYDGYIYAINADGTLKWKFKTGHAIISSPALDKTGILYIGSMDGKIYAINHNGTERWSKKLQSDKEYHQLFIESSPAIGYDGTIYIGSRFSSDEPSWGYLHAIKGGVPTGVDIIRPREGYLHIGFREIGPTLSGKTVIVGKIIVEGDIRGMDYVEKVEFYLDDQLIETVYETPFAIMLDETAFWKHTILAKAYYIDGSTPTDQMDVMIFNI